MSDAGFTLGKYKLQNCIASGQTTQIWEGVDEGGTDKYAIKMILPEAFKNPDNKKVLKHEAMVLKRFDHPNIVKFKELVIKKEYGFFVMELFKTPNVKQLIQSDLVSVQSRLKRLVELSCLSLGYVHSKRYIHRDVKPDNLLFNRSSDFRLVDFSLTEPMVRGVKRLLYRRKLLVQGTRTYMSPEQILGRILTPASDLYSLGISIYEITTGKPPFQGSNPKELLRRHLETVPVPPSEMNPNLTDEMDKFIMRLLSKKPKDRPKDTSDLMAEFRGINVWKEPPESLVKVIKGEDKQDYGLGERRDSRSDALRQEQLKLGKLSAGGPKPPTPGGGPIPPRPPVGAGGPPAPPGAPRPPAPPPPPGRVAPPPPPPAGGPTAPPPPRPAPPPPTAPRPAAVPPRPPAPPVSGAPAPPRPPAPPSARPAAPPPPRPPAPPSGGGGLDDFKVS